MLFTPGSITNGITKASTKNQGINATGITISENQLILAGTLMENPSGVSAIVIRPVLYLSIVPDFM